MSRNMLRVCVLALSLAAGSLWAQPVRPLERAVPSVAEVVPDVEYPVPPQTVDHVRATVEQAEALLSRGRADEAVAMLQAEVHNYPERLDLRMAFGNLAVRAGKYDLAVATFQDVLKQERPGSEAAGTAYLRLGEAYRRNGELEPSLSALREAVKILPNNLVAVTTYALVLDQEDRPAEAERQYRKVIELDPRNGVATNNLAYLLADHGGNLDEALELAERAQVLLPDMPDVTDTIAWIYLKKKDTGRAIAVLEPLVEKEGRSTFRYHLAMALVQKGLTATAVEQLKAALAGTPTSEEAAKIRQMLSELGK